MMVAHNNDHAHFVNSLMVAPVGVALLAFLEAQERDDVPPLSLPLDSEPRAVERALSSLYSVSYGHFLDQVLRAAYLAGPWTGGIEDWLASAYEQAALRRPLANAIAGRFRAILHAPLSLERQEFWLVTGGKYQPAFGDYSAVYGNGEFTWASVPTVTDPPPEIHDSLTSAWDFTSASVSRWRLPVRSEARIWRIDSPSDWVSLVTSYPKIATRLHDGWELPGPNQPLSKLQRLLAAPDQRAVRSSIGQHVLPDWATLATDYDAVHLSWAGFLTTEGYISDVPGGSVTMLRYWGSERTEWLRDVFNEPTPLPAPALTRSPGNHPVDVTRNSQRREQDRVILASVLGR
jgi:hypothetical protein